MKRNKFIKTTATFAAATALTPIVSCKTEPKKGISEVGSESVRKNWAGNYVYRAEHLYEPSTVEEVRTLIKQLDAQKALGSCHCFNNIADSPLNQISTKNLKGVLGIDEEAMTVTVGAGTKYGDFAPELHKKGYALHNLASLPHISVAGAGATATHGSGVDNGNLASSVAAIELVDGSGKVVWLKRGDDMFDGAIVNLGALGIITKVTLDILKTFEVRQDVFQDLPLESLKENFDAILSGGYSVSLFTDWMDEKVSQVWVKRQVNENGEVKDLGDEYYGAKAATRNLHPITALSAENCTEQMGVPGPWYDRLPHFKMGFTPSSGEELQSEFFVPKEKALEAILALEKKREQIHPQLMITEIRTVAADTLWMSPCYEQDCVTIHFTWKQNPKEVGELISMIEAELEPFQYRPHWGKIFSTEPATLASRYKKYGDFLSLAKQLDPRGKFKNDYLNLNIYPVR